MAFGCLFLSKAAIDSLMEALYKLIIIRAALIGRGTRQKASKRDAPRNPHNAFNDILSRRKLVRFPQEDQRRFLRKSFA